MAGRIQGITVEIGGDTTKLQTALKGVNTEIRNTQSQLRDVDKLLKLDPGNTELLAQKHRLLGDAVKEEVEADSGGVTEAGTTQRDVVREGVVQIGVTFRVSKKWLNKFSAYKKLASITVGYLDMETMNIVNTQMYIDGYQVKLVSDTSYGSLWEISFTLKEF